MVQLRTDMPLSGLPRLLLLISFGQLGWVVPVYGICLLDEEILFSGSHDLIF